MARMMKILPRGEEVAGYRAVFAYPHLTPSPNPDLLCGDMSVALLSHERAPKASTLVVLTGTGPAQERYEVESYSYVPDVAVTVMEEMRAALPGCAAYNAEYADFSYGFGLKEVPPVYPVGDEALAYRVLEPPFRMVSSSQIVDLPTDLADTGRTVTFVRTGGVITQYKSLPPRRVFEAFESRFRRASDAPRG
ncbi:hypothetical protein ACFQ9J_21040 [Streptomyces sp. NPDC056529]|uniref:hypothetical protein n=1 Tax=Streptomyces sp. NPDC056529 TaxID=3345855 RepID=UPI0036942B9D